MRAVASLAAFGSDKTALMVNRQVGTPANQHFFPFPLSHWVRLVLDGFVSHSSSRKVMPHLMRHPYSLARKNGSPGKTCEMVVRISRVKPDDDRKEYTLPYFPLSTHRSALSTPPPPLFLRVFFVIFPLQKENQELFLLMAGKKELPDAPTHWNIGSER